LFQVKPRPGVTTPLDEPSVCVTETPDMVGLVGVEPALNQIWRGRSLRTTLRGRKASPTTAALDPQLAHQSRHRLAQAAHGVIKP
jgi:hypothetical protein